MHPFLVLILHLLDALCLMTITRQHIPHQSFNPSLYDIVTENHLIFIKLMHLTLFTSILFNSFRNHPPAVRDVVCEYVRCAHNLQWCQRNSMNNFANRSIILLSVIYNTVQNGAFIQSGVPLILVMMQKSIQSSH